MVLLPCSIMCWTLHFRGVVKTFKDRGTDAAVSPGRSAGAARTAWGSFRGRGSGRSPPGWSPSAAPDPKTARWLADSAPRHHRRTWRPDPTGRPRSARATMRRAAIPPRRPGDVSAGQTASPLLGRVFTNLLNAMKWREMSTAESPVPAACLPLSLSPSPPALTLCSD